MIQPKVLFFDVNETLLDLTAMKEKVGELLNGRKDLLPLWFRTMLHYSVVSTAAGQYKSFAKIGAATMQMVAANNGITLSKEDAEKEITTALRSLPAHPDVKPALEILKNSDFKLVSFTNSSDQGVKAQFEYAGLIDYFDESITVESIKKFKPFTEFYLYGSKYMGIKPEESMLIAAHGWDIAGALWAGWRAAFIKRPGAQLYPLAPLPEIIGADLKEVTQKLLSS